MPVARGPDINGRSAVLVGLTGVAIALVLGAMVLWATRSGGAVQIRIGDSVFDAGFADRQSQEIANRGPILYADAGSSGQRDLYLQHIGDDPETGWLAFSARRVGDPRDCTAVWDPGQSLFALESTSDVECDAVTFNELGCGLVRYPAEVVDGKITVFLNEDFDGVAAALGSDDESDSGSGPDLSCPEP